MKRFFVILLLLVFAVSPAKSAELKIAATVGDEAITTYDMINRTKLIISSSGLKPDEDTFKKIAPQALQSLINDKIIMQEAAALSVTISEDEINEAIKSIEQKNKMPEGSLENALMQFGIPKATLEEQVKSQIAMSKIRSIKVRQYVNISDEEVEDFVKAQSFNSEVEEYFMNEIVLPVESPADEAAVKELADKLHQELKAGKNFAAIAREFSQSASAYNDGILGWMPENQLPKEITAEIKKNDLGVVSEPIRSIEGYFIVKATEKRKQSSLAQEDELNLKHFEIPYSEKPDAKKTAEIFDKLSKLSYSDDACNDSSQFAIKGGMNYKDYGFVKVADIEPKIRPLVAELAIGTFSAPLKTLESGLVFLVCEKIENIAPLIDDNKRAKAREALFYKKLDLQARKYMRDLRRKTNVEIKL